MCKSNPKQEQVYTSLANSIVDFLRRRHPAKTPESVAAETGLPPGTVKNWLRGLSGPSADALVTLIDRYQVELLAALPLAQRGWAEILARAARLEVLEAEISRAEASLKALRAVL